MKPLVTSIAAAIICASVATAQDLSESVSPGLLPHLYELAFDELEIQDFRVRIGEFTGVRLLCLNERSPSYTFTIVESRKKKRGEPRVVEWTEIGKSESRQKVRRVGEQQLVTEDWEEIEAVLRSKEFQNLPCATMPVAVGHPYVFLVEVFGEGSYRALYRDQPNWQSDERRLKMFNLLAERLIASSKITDLHRHFPVIDGGSEEISEAQAGKEDLDDDT